MSTDTDWLIAIEESGRARRFEADALPISIGGSADDDIRLDDVSGSLQIGMLDEIFFVQPTRQTVGLRVQGEAVRGSRRLADGDVIALGSARLTCRLAGGRLKLEVEALVAAGDTAPPDWQELADGAPDHDELAITPIAFRPGAGAQGGRDRRPSVTALLASAGFLVLGVLGWFAFTAKAVELRFEPGVDQVSVPGTFFKLNVGGRFLLRSGQHRIVAEASGYYPLDTIIEVGRAPDQSFELELTRLPGLVTVATEPETDAEVYVNGELLGRTPLVDVEIPPGNHQLRITAERFLPAEHELSVPGGGERQRLTAELTPNWAPVRVATEPPGAEIRVDGQSTGQVSPAELELGAGRREIEVRLAGYNAWRDTITVQADQPQELPAVRLVEADGRLELVSQPEDAAVSVDGEFRGRTPLTLTLRPGRAHRVTLTKPGFSAVTRELSVAADSGRRVAVELTPQIGEVEVVSSPPEAEIWVNGDRQGTTPGLLELLAVAHEIEVRREGYAPATLEVTPRPGFPQQLSFALEALDDASGDGYPRVIRTGLGQELRLVPAGEFTMGTSRNRDQYRRANEVLRPVRLTRAFYLGTREVTNAEFRRFRAEHDSGEFAGETLDGDDQPVVRVTWEEAAQFLNWLSIQDGLQPVYEEVRGMWVARRPLRNGYRLPTEAEWAWAARYAGGQVEEPLHYPWGAELPPPDRSGNYADVSAAHVLPNSMVVYNDGFPVSAPVGSFPPNALGLYDLGGNVAEWVQDFYDAGLQGTSQTVIQEDPLGPETGRFRVIRGPSWRSATQTDLRLAYRHYGTDGREDVGFRIARNLE